MLVVDHYPLTFSSELRSTRHSYSRCRERLILITRAIHRLPSFGRKPRGNFGGRIKCMVPVVRRRATFMENRGSLCESRFTLPSSFRHNLFTRRRHELRGKSARRLLLNKESRSRLCDNVDRDCDPPNNVMRAISRCASRTRTTRSHNPKREHSNPPQDASRKFC